MHSCKNDQPCDIFALHGFLGLPSDWAQFTYIQHPVKLDNEGLDFSEWSKKFNNSLTKESKKKVLLGYSMGGRLGMHAVIAEPKKWHGAIFVSAHPGLISQADKAARFKADQDWANKFLHCPWEALMKEWNSNPVFGNHSFPYPRTENSFDRNKLSKQLTNWSLGKQQSLIEMLKDTRVPMLVISGEGDSKFCQIAEEFSDFATVSIIPQAAHRVPWDQPAKFTTEIQKFIEGLL